MNFNQLNKGRKKSHLDLSTMVYGKVPPQAKDLEEALLGALMIEKPVTMDVRQILKPEDFYVEAHQRIYRAICSLDDKNQPIDLLTVISYLRDIDELEIVGGPYYVTKLTNSVVSSANNVKWAMIVKQYSVARKLIGSCGEIINEAFNNSDPLTLLAAAEQKFFEINSEVQEIKNVTLDKIAWELAKKILVPEQLTPEELEAKYLYTGMADWDRINGPLFPGGVYTLAARPGMGKTAHVIQMIVNMAKRFPVGLINVEMTDEQLAKRIVSNIKEINNYLYKKKVEEWTEEEKKIFYEGIQEFVLFKLFIESEITDIDQIISKIKFWVKKFGVRVVFIDYLQILRVADELAKYMTDVQALNYILERIRACAKELNISIFLLSQLNRELYRRAGNKEPNLGDLKGSGKIEEISFQICFLHRPEYYDPENSVDEMGESTKGLCYQIIAKHRDGELGKIKHRFIPQFTKFEEWFSNISAYVAPSDDVPF